jgi:hypothetical protein
MFQNKNSASVRANNLFDGVEKNFKINISQKDFVEKKEGDIIYQNGEPADYVYLILEGEVKQKISGIFTSPVIVKSSKDEFFGEKEVIENNNRSSSAVANTDCLLYKFDRNSIINIAGQNRVVKRNLYKSMQIDESEDTSQTPESQKSFFIGTEDSTTKFTIPDNKDDNKDRVEILDEDIADREDAEPLPAPIPDDKGNEEAALPEEIINDTAAVEDEIVFEPEPEENINFFESGPLVTDSEQENPDATFTYTSDVKPGENAENNSDLFNMTEPGESMNIQDSIPAEISGNIFSNNEENISPFSSEEAESIQDNTDSPGLPRKAELFSSAETREFSAQETAGLISNDIIYPLNTLRFYADQIKKRGISTELNEVVDLLIEQANIIQDLADAVYDFTEDRSSLNLSSVNINQALDEILGLLADFIESRSSVLYKKYDSAAVVDLDKRKFFHAMYQSAKLLCQTMPEGGKIYVVLSSDDNNAQIEMKCTSAESQKHKIIPEVKFNSAGMGYLIAEKIIKEHGGSLKFSRGDNSAAITISIPVNR